MISICVAFYPWYRDYDRSEEIFDVLIKGLNNTQNPKKLEICITDAGVEDIYINRKNSGRHWDHRAFHKRLRAEFKGAINYRLDEGCIHVDEEGHKRFWMAKAIVESVNRAGNENLLLFGIDCYVPKDFITRYNSIVKEGTAWVPFAFNVPKGGKLEVVKTNKGYCWHTARGIVGIKKSDYRKVGGYEGCLDLIQMRTDSSFYNRMKDKLKIVERREVGLFHVGHKGTNASRFWRIEDVPRE
jgi:hypothetical protein